MMDVCQYDPWMVFKFSLFAIWGPHACDAPKFSRAKTFDKVHYILHSFINLFASCTCVDSPSISIDSKFLCF